MTEGHRDKQTHREIDGKIDRRMDIQIDRQTERRIDIIGFSPFVE
jgi:hypothetical protein